MLPPVQQRLLSATGTLSAQPLPLLLHALWDGRHSAVLTLSAADGRQKRLLLREGALQACESNDAGETLLASLVARGVLEADYARRVQEAAQASGMTHEAMLMQLGALDGPALQWHHQALLAQRILDCFGPGWTEAAYTLAPAPPTPDGPRLNMLQLLLYGMSHVTPLEVVHAHLPESTRLRRRVPPPAAWTSLRPTNRESGVLELLGTPLTAAGVAARSNLSKEEAARRLFALAVLELVEEDVARPTAAPSAVVQVVRFLREEQPRLEMEEPRGPVAEAPPEPVPSVEPEGDITGIIPTHGLPPLPGADAEAPDITGVYRTPEFVLQSLGASPVVGGVELPAVEPQALPPVAAGARRARRGKRRGALAVAGLVVLAGLGGAVMWRLKPASVGAVPPPVAAAAQPEAQRSSSAPRETWVAAPPGARAQPLKPRQLSLSASGMTLPLPAGRELAQATRLLMAGNAAGALARFEALAHRKPANAEAWYGAAVALYGLERDGEARVKLHRALEAAPEHAPSHLLLGFLEHQAAAMPEARAHYERFLANAKDGPLAADVWELLSQLP
ncbi:MAG: tetratricopeptide repeat protein [Myxococcaceae bacterium]|nr:tetratricopeptide repeat protein [Myxococcaceae bacterium]MCI0669501.1 tetratricopeptide repeat protein [Myxococcaceae bacterium]